MRTWAPILNSFRRMVPHVALARRVAARAISPTMTDFLFFLRRGFVVLSLSAAEGIIHSALLTTRRWRLQLLCVLYWKSLKRRAGLPLWRFSAAASASSAAISAISLLF